MEIETIKPLVNKYVKNLSLLFVTNTPVEIQNYLNFFQFLFKKRIFEKEKLNGYLIYL